MAIRLHHRANVFARSQPLCLCDGPRDAVPGGRHVQVRHLAARRGWETTPSILGKVNETAVFGLRDCMFAMVLSLYISWPLLSVEQNAFESRNRVSLHAPEIVAFCMCNRSWTLWMPADEMMHKPMPFFSCCAWGPLWEEMDSWTVSSSGLGMRVVQTSTKLHSLHDATFCQDVDILDFFTHARSTSR